MSDPIEQAKKVIANPEEYDPMVWKYLGRKLIAEVERLRSDLVICDEVDEETQVVLNHYEELIDENHKLRSEVTSVVTEISSIKAERNAVIKAHADLLSECRELKIQLKFLAHTDLLSECQELRAQLKFMEARISDERK